MWKKSSIKILLLMVILLGLTACSRNIVQLEKLGLVFGTGVDKVEGDSKIYLTAQVIGLPEGNKNTEKTSGTKSCETIQSTGDTIFEAVRNATDKCFRPLYFSHSKLIIFNSKLAEEGIRNYLDMFFRNTQPRPNIWILISDGDAREILNEIPGLFIDNLIRTKKERATVSAQNMHDFMTRVVDKTTAPITSMISIKKTGDRVDLVFLGTAVFEEDRMIGVLNEKETRGLLWVLNEIKSNVVVVDSADKRGKIAIEILDLKSKVKPEMKDGEFKIKIDVNTSGRIVELLDKEDITNIKVFNDLKKRMAATIEEEILMSLKKSKSLKADIYGFGDEINKKYHKEFKEVENQWQEIFTKIDVDVNVRCKILGIGIILKTLNSSDTH